MTEILKQKLFIPSDSYLDLFNILRSAGGAPRFVGGLVRDSLINLDQKSNLFLENKQFYKSRKKIDLDVITCLLPDKVIEILNYNNIKVIPTGIEHGTVTAILHNEYFEITTLRRDVSCNGRYALVEFSNNFEEDAARRDFTINAISYCPFTEQLFDYFGGISDLKKQIVRFIGSPDKRIKEDFLRILRFLRFSAFYAKELDQEGVSAVINHRNLLKNLSKERIKSEIDKLLDAPLSKFINIVSIMKNQDIWPIIFPFSACNILCDFKQISIKEKIDREFIKKELKEFDNLQELTFWSRELKYSLLFADDFFNSKLNKKEMILSAFSNNEIKYIFDFCRFSQELEIIDINFLLKLIWFERHKDYISYLKIAYIRNKISINRIKDFIDLYKNRIIPDFPVDGHDLINIGQKGKQIGFWLDFLKKQWIKSDFSLDKAILLSMIK